VSTNVDVQDGLFNGSTGILKKIEYATAHDKRRIPHRCWIDFKNPLIGISKRTISKSYQNRKKINAEWTSIERVTKNINISRTGRLKGFEIIRNQLPLVAANGMTITKSQGSSIPCVVVSIKPFCNRFGKQRRKLSRELLYVACSRATSLKGLFIDGTFEPPVKPSFNDPVTLEMERLRSIPFSFSLKFIQTIGNQVWKLYFHNVQSFNAHSEDVACDKCALDR